MFVSRQIYAIIELLIIVVDEAGQLRIHGNATYSELHERGATDFKYYHSFVKSALIIGGFLKKHADMADELLGADAESLSRTIEQIKCVVACMIDRMDVPGMTNSVIRNTLDGNNPDNSGWFEKKQLQDLERYGAEKIRSFREKRLRAGFA